MKKKFSKILVFVIVFTTVFGSFNFASDKDKFEVTKVVFRELKGSLRHVGFGAVRFYNEGSIIEPGNLISKSDDGISAETDLMSMTASSTHDGTYSVFNAFDTSIAQGSTVESKGYWIAPADTGTTESITVDFKTPQIVDKVEYIALPDANYSDRGIQEIFYIDIYVSDGSIRTYKVTPRTQENLIEGWLFGYTPEGINLDIESDQNDLKTGSSVDVFVEINNAHEIYAGDFTVKYDTSTFGLLSTELVNNVDHKIYHKLESDGQVRFIIAANGEDGRMMNTANLVKLSFKVLGNGGDSRIGIHTGKVADYQGTVYNPTNYFKTFYITNPLDVNEDTEINIGDVAISSYMFGKDSYSWGNNKPDVDENGLVESIDIELIVADIIAQ